MSEKESLLLITSFAYEINTTTNNDVFVNYSPHVNDIEVSIYIGGWKRDANATEYKSAYLNGDVAYGKSTLDEIIEILKEVLENG